MLQPAPHPEPVPSATSTETQNEPGPSRLPRANDQQAPPTHNSQDSQHDDSDSDGDEPEYDPDDDANTVFSEFPISHELVMKDHTKVVSALALDPSGARFVSGSHDYDCKLWDFGGMSATAKPFKTWEPAGTYYVRQPCLRPSSSIAYRCSFPTPGSRSQVFKRRHKISRNPWYISAQII